MLAYTDLLTQFFADPVVDNVGGDKIPDPAIAALEAQIANLQHNLPRRKIITTTPL